MAIDIFVPILNIKFLLSPLFLADSLNCFEQAGPHEDITRIDCQMHNACQKISDSKSKSLKNENLSKYHNQKDNLSCKLSNFR